MVLVEGTLQISADSAPAEADGEIKSNKSDSEPYMRHRLRDRLSFWNIVPACSVLLYTMCIVLSVMIFLFNDHNNVQSKGILTKII